jgi:hypothetical protein
MGELQIAHNLLGNGLENRLLLGLGGNNSFNKSLVSSVDKVDSVGIHFVKGGGCESLVWFGIGI